MSNKDQAVLTVAGMTCGSCKRHVEEALMAVPGVSNVDVDVTAGMARVRGTAPIQTLLEAVEGAGYQATISNGGEPGGPKAASCCRTA